MSESATVWYIIKIANNTCQIVTQEQIANLDSAEIERWGPYDARSEAIAKRVGLIRVGKCQPV
jgi:hypothetical protein